MANTQSTDEKSSDLRYDSIHDERPVTLPVVAGLTLVFSLLFSFLAVTAVVVFFPQFVRTQQNEIVVSTLPRRTDETTGTYEPAVEAIKAVRPAVVSIIVQKDLSDDFEPDPFQGFDFGDLEEYIPEGMLPIGGGTGFIVSENGLILTNRHVVDDDEAEYKIFLEDGQSFTAIVVDRDSINDLAVLKIAANDLPVAALGDSSLLELGQTVLAIGNSLSEYSNSVTKGVVSGIGRSVIASDGRGTDIEELEGVIQTDAAINFGNSGGPLINLSGEVIGINTAVDRTGQSVGFAIPINDAKVVIETVKKFGHIVRPQLGVRYILINSVIQEANDLSVTHGALVIAGESSDQAAVVPGGPADKAGIAEHDIILEVDGTQVTLEHSLVQIVQHYEPGDTVTLKVLRDGKERNVSVMLGAL